MENGSRSQAEGLLEHAVGKQAFADKAKWEPSLQRATHRVVTDGGVESGEWAEGRPFIFLSGDGGDQRR